MKNSVQKKIAPIDVMSSRQQKMQQKKWTEERNRRYQCIKDKKAKERENITIVVKEECEWERDSKCELPAGLTTNQIWIPELKEAVVKKEPLCEESVGMSGPTLDPLVIKEVLCSENMCIPKPKSKEKILADKRQREKLRYQNIKNNPELYANYQRKNNIKYEKLKAQKKILLINEMSARQQKLQREKWRKERNRRYQRNKDKKAKERQLIMENCHESGIESAQLLDTPAEQESVTVKETFCQENIGSCDPNHESYDTVVIKEDPLLENVDKLKPKSKEELLADKRHREKLRYQNIKNNPELYANYQRKNNIKYEKLKAQKKIVLINEMSAQQQKLQREKWRKERNRRYQRIKDKKAKERRLIMENCHENGIESAQLLDTPAEQESVTVKETFCQENIGSCDPNHESYDTVVIKEDPLLENVDKLKPKSKEELLADKRHREKLRYQNIKNNPELYANYQRKNNIKYEKLKAQKKIVLINEMSAQQQKLQREKWRKERNRRYQRIKDKKAKERRLIMENCHENGIESAQLLDTPAEQESVTVKETFCQENIGSCDPNHESYDTVVIKEDPLLENVDKLKPKSKEELLADKRHREKIRYQNIKNNPELYANYQRKNNIKYEKLKAQKKIVLINEMSAQQQKLQREKWRKERNSRYQRIKDKKEKERRLIMENCHESDIESAQLLDTPAEQESVTVKETFCQENIGSCDPNHESYDTVVIKEDPLLENVDKLKPKSKEELLADKRHREKLRYQNIKNNPELYANYQRKNNIKYEKLKAQKKIVLINEMSAQQQKLQREKWRKERNRRYQRIKDKKAKERRLIMENCHENGIESAQLLDTPAEQESVTVKETFCQENIGSCDPNHESYDTVVIKEDPLLENVDKLKPKSKEELLADKRHREKIRYQNIKNNPELYANYQRKNNIKYEKLKAQKKIVLINEMSAQQQKLQREKWRKERNSRYQRIKDKKAKERRLIMENCHESDIESAQLLDTPAEQESVTVKETFCQENIGSCDPNHESYDTVVIKEDPLLENVDKLKPKSKEELLADKRHREKLRYQNIKNNPELYANYQRKNNIKYEKLKAQKKIVLINEMSAQQQKLQREKWRKERNSRYQRIKDKRAKERRLIMENCHESDIESAQLLDTPAEQESVTVKETFCQENIGPCDPNHESYDTVVIKEDPLLENVDKLKPKSKEELLADKRHREKLRYQNIKNNPELYANYQRKNNIKYEKLKAHKKIVLIKEKSAREQKLQREKWRKERNRRYQRIKDKKAKERQLIMEKCHGSGIESVQLLDAPEEQDIIVNSHKALNMNMIKNLNTYLKETAESKACITEVKEEAVAQESFYEQSICDIHDPLVIKEEFHAHGAVVIKESNAHDTVVIKESNANDTVDIKESNAHDSHDTVVIKEYNAHDTGVIKNAFHSHDTMVIKESNAHDTGVIKNAFHSHDTVVIKESNTHDTGVIKNAFHSHDTVVIKESNAHDTGVIKNAFHSHDTVVIKESNAHDTGVIKTAFHSHDTVVIKESHPHDAVVIKKELSRDSRASHALTSLYEDHEVKDELVLGPECLQRSGAPAALQATVGSSSTHLQPRTAPRSTQEPPKPPSSKHKPKASPKKHPCQTCGKEFKRATHLKSHMLTHTGLKPFTCEVCKKEFAFIGNLRTHKRVHTGEKPFCCEICKMCFTNSGALKMHRRIHAGLKPHSCDICFKTFRASDTLNRHKRTHTGEKPYMCEICQKRFNETGELRKHKRTHTGEKPFSCEFCEKKFSQLSNLKNHQRTHTGEKPYACKACERKFSQLINMKKHEKIHTRVANQSSAIGFTDKSS